MSTQRQNQAKPSSPSSALPVQTGLFQPRPFTDFSPEADEALDVSHQPPDLQTQLDRASRFGHNFSRVQVQVPHSSVIQPQMERGTLEEQEEDSEVDSVAESVKQMAPPGGDPSQPPDQEEELVQTMPLLGVLPPVIQRQDQEEELVQAMPLLGVLPPVIQRQDQEEELVQAMPHWGRLQRLPQDEDDASIQMMPQWGVIQRQEPESVEEAIQSQWLQPKLVVGEVGDRYEQEADSVAAQVMSMSAPPTMPEPIQRQSEKEDEQESLVQTSPLADSITPLVQRQEIENTVQLKCSQCEQEERKQEEQVQTTLSLQHAAISNIDGGNELESQLSSSKGGGSPLPDEVRSFMEPRFGNDFSQVRVHTDGEAVQMNRVLGAQAFTHGSDIYFGSGKSPTISHLTAHELTHVVQQTSAVQPKSISEEYRTQFVQKQQLQQIRESEAQQNIPEAKSLANKTSKITSNKEQLQRLGTSKAQQEALEARNLTSEISKATSNKAQLQLRREGDEQHRPLATQKLSNAINQAISNKEAFQLPPLENEHASTQTPGMSEAAESEEIADSTPQQAQPEARQAAEDVDRGKIEEKKNELLAEEQPAIDQTTQELPQAEQATQDAANKVNEPAKPLVEPKSEAATLPESSVTGAMRTAEQAANLAEQASGEQFVSMPTPPAEVAPPEMAEPVDAGGELLPSDPAMDAQIMNLAQQAQSLREGGHHLQAQAGEARTNAQIIRGNIQKIQQGISQSEQGVEQSTNHLQSRQELVGQAEQALQVSEQKANTVAEQAPGFVEKADEGKAESGPMAEGANELTAENASRTPDDPEASAKAQEQGQKLNKVGSDTATVDDAVTQTKEKASSLGEEAAQAQATNAETQTKITTMKETLGQTNERLSQMKQQNTQARSQVESYTEQPAQMTGKAEVLEQQGQELIQASLQIEQRLQQIQADYLQEMSAIPAAEGAGGNGEQPGETAIQMDAEEGGVDLFGSTEEGRYDERETVDLVGELPSWATGVDPATEEQREQARQQAEERRQQQIQQINQMAGGNFETLSAGQKVGIALQLTGQNIANSISNIQWPSWGQLAQGLLDPRATLTGVISGLSMMLSGGANLLSAEQWAQDPLGNLLKSAADIATGLTIVLGSITALAALIIGIMGAITLLSLGTAAPVTGPVIAFCTTVMATVGGWTIAVGKVALVLQALVLIKNLIDAATAETAEQLQNQSDQITQDVANAGNVVMQIGGAKLAQVGGRQMQSAITQAGGGTRFAAQMGAQGLPSRIVGGVRSAGGVRAYAGALRSGARARVAAAGGRRAFLAQSGRSALGGARDAARRTWRELWDEAPEGLSTRQGFSRDYLVSDDVPLDSARPRTPQTPEPDLVPDSASRPRDVGEAHPTTPDAEVPAPRTDQEAPAPRSSDGTADISDTTPESSSARESSVRDSGHIESDQLSDRQIRNELDHISDHPDIVEGTPPNRRARVGDHEWQEQPGGGWCRHSDGLVCIPGSNAPKPSRQDRADEAAPSESVTSSETSHSSRERLTIENNSDVQRLRDNPPTKPAHLNPEEEVLWNDYVSYYNERLDAIDRELASSGVVKSEPPRNWESYVEARGRFTSAQRGTAFQQTVTDEAQQIEGFDVQSNVGVSRTAKPGRGQGEVHFPDQLIVDRETNGIIATSNKSRDFANLPNITRQVEADVEELITKYSGQLYVRRRGHLLNSSEPVNVQEIVLVYDNRLIPTTEMRSTIARIAERKAHELAPDVVFWITFQ